MEFKELDVKEEESWLKRTFRSQHTKKTIVFIIIGALGGLLYYYLSKGKNMDAIIVGDVLKSMFLGGFFGFFITNSPCSRNKC